MSGLIFLQIFPVFLLGLTTFVKAETFLNEQKKISSSCSESFYFSLSMDFITDLVMSFPGYEQDTLTLCYRLTKNGLGSLTRLDLHMLVLNGFTTLQIQPKQTVGHNRTRKAEEILIFKVIS